ncbi:hypothetical protein Tco_1427544 [Tanacetum coccineum]
MSLAEAEYVAAAGCCAQVLWIKSQLANYNVLYDKVPIFYDNTSAISISNNPMLHSRTKHIDIRYHFIRDHILKGDIELHFVPTDLQLADIFTKPLAEPSFTRLVAELGMLNITSKVYGLEYLKEYVSLLDHEAVKDAIVTLGLRNQGSHDQLNVHQQMIAYALCWGLNIDIAGVLYDDLISKLSARGKQGREKNICYTRYMSLVMEHLLGKDYVNNELNPTKSFMITNATFKKSTLPKVPLTSHMRKVAKLDEDPLITPFKETHIEASEDVSPTPISQTSESQHAEGTEVTADTTQSLDAAMSAEEQDNHPQTANTTKEQENVVTKEVHMADDGTEFVDPVLYSIGNVTLESLNQTVDESPFDTESEIRVVKRFKPATDDEESLFTSKESDTKEDSELASIPDDEIGSPSAFQTSDTKESLSEPKLSKSKEKDADNVLDKLADLQASADKPSDSISHIKEEITSLSTKIGQMESNITNKVSEEIHSFVPVLITEALKQELSGLLTDALKTTLPALLKDLIKESVDTSVEEKLPIFNEEIQKSFKAQIPKLFIQPMNKELIAFNKLEANRFIHLQEELNKTTMIVHSLEGKGSKEKKADESESDDDDPIAKRLKVLIPTPKPLQSIISDPPRDITPSRDPSKGKEITTEEDPLKQLVPFLKQSGSDPKAINLHQFSEYGKKMTLEEAHEQMMYQKRIADQKAAEEKTKRSLQRINFKAQKAELDAYEAKRTKMLAEYNHYINFRAHSGRITKINYKIDKVNKDATMRIERDNQPLSLTVMEKFRLKQLGFTEWIEVQDLASKGKGKAIDTLLRSLKAKFEWIKTQAGKLGLSPPSELTAFRLTPAEKKRKRTFELVKEVFVTQDIRVPGMKRNLIPPQGVIGSPGLVITEPEAGIFYYNGNFDLVFQRENEFHLATSAQLIKQLKHINRDTPEGQEMYKKMLFAIEARHDVAEAE